MLNNQSKYPSFYIKSLDITGLKCFKEKTHFDFSDANGNPERWNIILGNNNTGKSTILKAISGLERSTENFQKDKDVVRFGPRIIAFIGRDIIEDTAIISSQIISSSLGQKEWLYRCFKNGGVGCSISKEGVFENFLINGYGVRRRSGNKPIEGASQSNNSITLFENDETLINIKDWLLQLDYAIKNGALRASERLELVRKTLFNGLLPGIKDFRVYTDEKFNSIVEFDTEFGWRTFDEIGYGYQTSLAWIADFMKRMFDRYPESENPLSEPAIVLIDELDLHLHPEWLRRIISFLTNAFSGTQFIVTTHNPLIVQSAENVNLIVLKKDGDHVRVEQPKIPSFRGWTVEEILSEFMDLDGKVMSDEYINTLAAFDEALDKENLQGAKEAYEKLLTMLHPESTQRKLIRMQFNELSLSQK